MPHAAQVAPTELAALKELALAGGRPGKTHLSSEDLAQWIGVSRQTASRRLQSLADAGLVEREIVDDGQWVAVTDAGERALRREYETYRKLFDTRERTSLDGHVTGGLGEGKHYITLPGYLTQFRELLGYEPYPGTLNVVLTDESRRRLVLPEAAAIPIDGWEDEKRTYGPARVYPATVECGDDRYDGAHLIDPERTHHDASQLEIIAPDELRDVLELSDGQEVTIHVG